MTADNEAASGRNTSARAPTEEEIRNLVPRRSGEREFRVGIFLILGLVSFMSVLYLMTEPALFRGRYVIETIVDDAGGIRRGDPIQLRGVNIGRVSGFDLIPGGDSVAVLLEVEGEYPIPTGSTVLLEATSALGGLVVRIEPSASQEMVGGGDRLPGRRGADLMATLEAAGAEAQVTFNQVQDLFSDTMISVVQSSAEAMHTLLQDMDRVITVQGEEVSRLTETLSNAAQRLVESAPEGADVDRVLARTDSVLIELRETGRTLGAASGSLTNILAALERGEGTLGRLLQDDSLYRNLNAALLSAEALTTDLRENPGRYLTVKIF